MIQRFIYTVLAQGVAALETDPSILEDLFAKTWSLTPREVGGIREYFKKNPPRVQHGFARTDAKLPMLCIILQSESVSDYVLGDNMAVMGGDPDDQGCDRLGSIWEHTYQIQCFAEHPDVTLYLYEIAKSALLVNQNYFSDNGVMDPMLSGMDLAPDPRYIPDHVFARGLNLRCKREFVRIDRTSRAGKAFEVTGMWVPPEDFQDNGGVPTLVTPYANTTDEGAS